jgi:hypothetical protein
MAYHHHTTDQKAPSPLRGVEPSFLPGRWCGLDAGHAELDWRDAGKALGLLPFLPQEGEGEVDALDFTAPCWRLPPRR